MPTVWLALAVVAIIVLRRYARIAGSCLAIAVILAVLGWGYWTYAHGGAIAFAGVMISPKVFYGLVAVWFALETYSLVLHVRLRRRRLAKTGPETTDDSSDPA
jgi:TRAP-type C4-dicarboxylate transport system permease small subunit